MINQQFDCVSSLTESNENNQNEHQVQEERNEVKEDLYEENTKEEAQPVMVLNIDIGNDKMEHLKIYNLDQPEKDAYEFCFQHQLDYSSLVEINKQIHIILNENRKKANISTNEAVIQENIMTTVQTESKTDNIVPNNQSVMRNQNNNNNSHDHDQDQNQNHNLLSFTEGKENINKSHIDPKELIQNEIVVTENNKFYLVNKNKTNELKQQLGSKSMKNSKGFKQPRNKKDKAPPEMKFDKIGVKMYEKGLERMTKRNEKVESLRDALNKSDEEIYTFKPQVNNQTLHSKKYRENNNKAYNNPQIILNYKSFNERKQEKLKENIKAKYNDTANSILFTPAINKKSKNLDRIHRNNSASFSSRFEKLYQDKEKVKEKIKSISKELNTQYSYCPQLNKASPNIKRENIKQQNSLNSEKRKCKILHEIEYNNTYDKKTNQKFFQPKLIAKYKPVNENKKEENEKKRYESMYNYAEYYKKRKTDLAAEVNFIETVNTYSSSKTSNDLINKKKFKSFKQIFKLLDSDEDNIISSNSYNTSKLPKEIINILKPIFNEFKEDYETLNEVEFTRVCDQLYQYCSKEQKDILITFCDNKRKSKKQKHAPSGPSPFSFKPNINKYPSNIMKKIDNAFDTDLQNISRINAGNSFNNNI